MFYAPHTLYVKHQVVERDKYNRPVKSYMSWERQCECRCDDEMSQKFETEDGRVYRPKYHIVCPNGITVREDEEVRVMKGDDIRAEGKAIRIRRLNRLNYSEIWV